MKKKLIDLVAGARKNQPTPQEQEAAKKAELTARSQRCLDEIREVLSRNRCEIMAAPMIEQGSIVAGWGIQALE